MELCLILIEKSKLGYIDWLESSVTGSNLAALNL